MKFSVGKFFALALSLSLSLQVFASNTAFAPTVAPAEAPKAAVVEKAVNPKVKEKLEAFVKMTPKEYGQMTGKKMNLTETMKLKVAQKKVKKQLRAMSAGDQIPKWAYIILVLFGLGFIPIGIMTDWTGNDWWVNLLLSLCCLLPGIIHGFIKMKNYYN